MNAASARPELPQEVWRAPLLRPLDGRSRASVAGAAVVTRVPAGEMIAKAGEPADAVLVLASGSAEVVDERAGRGPSMRVMTCGEVLSAEAMVLAHAERGAGLRAGPGGCTVAALPASVLRRALARSGGSALVARTERSILRAAARHALRASKLGERLDDEALEVVLDAVQIRDVRRGEVLARAGEAADVAWLVGSGLLVTYEAGERTLSLEASARRAGVYAARGETVAASLVRASKTHTGEVQAAGPGWVVLLAATALSRLPDESGAGRARPPAFVPDLHRMRVARSLLVIDQSACVGCGHCTFACAATHEDGVPRLVRSGQAPVDEGWAATLRVAQSCQHCTQPACLPSCPTGAIVRAAGGDVTIREELCTGCEACVKACPWDAVQVVPRRGAGPVAVKCDLCTGAAAGPACVAACPTEALVRIDPNRALDAVARAAGGDTAPASPLGGEGVTRTRLPPRRSPAPMVAGAALVAAALVPVRAGARTSGALLLGLVVAIACVAVVKRLPRLARRFAAAAELGRRLHAAHLALGTATGVVLLVHARAWSPLFASCLVVVATGALLGALYVAVPRRLARIAPEMRPEEDLDGHRAALDERAFMKLSGRSALVKTIFARIVGPEMRAPGGALRTLFFGGSTAVEERRLAERIERATEGRASARLEGVDALVRLAVASRATRAVAVGTTMLRFVTVLHVAASAITLVAIAAHVAAMVGRP